MNKRYRIRFDRLLATGTMILSGVAAVWTAPAVAETRALLAGVWTYNSSAIPDLKGPENDLGAVEALLRKSGASDVTVLRNEAVSRTTMETALHALGLRSKAGDWIVLYYSGHGAQAEAAVKGTRDGDLDQFLPLAGFDPDAQDVERFIVDKDFYDWLARYVPAGVRVLMIADTCHSGTMNRSVEPRAFHFTARVVLRGEAAELRLVPRPAPRFESVLATTRDIAAPLDRADLPNLVFIGAAQDGQLALEAALPNEGAPSRGLLTYALEQGLGTTGADGKTLLADLDGNGTVEVSEIAVYVDGQVRTLSAQRQHPRTAYAAGRDADALLAAPPAAPTVPVQPPLPGIHASDPRAAGLLRLADAPWQVAGSAAAADFVWDYPARTLLRRTGDIVAQGVGTTAALRGVIEKWRTVEALRPFLNEEHGRLAIGPQDNGTRYRPGSKVTVAYRGAPGAGGYATIFNLAGDGTVQLLYPAAPEDGDGKLDRSGQIALFQNQVVAPFGTDHVVALVTPVPPNELRALLHTLDNQRAPLQAVEPIRRLLGEYRGRATLSLAELYTGN